MTELIAEIGWNHMGDLDIAESMIRAASESGATYAKFQSWSVERLKNGSWDEDGRRQIYENAELSVDKHKFLINLCEKYNIAFLSSAFSIPDAQLLVNLDVEKVKIPSFEATNRPLVEFCIKHFKKIFISTGTLDEHELNELSQLVSSVDNTQIVVMHCVSSYPCPLASANLPRIELLKTLFANVGYSDHVQGITASVYSLAYAPQAIEKHFTVDHDLPGRDNKFAVLPHELHQLYTHIDNSSLAYTSHGIGYQECELDSRTNYRGRFNNV